MNLDEYRQAFSLSLDQFVKNHKITSTSIHENLRYERIENVTRIDFGDGKFFFFKSGKLRLIYLSDERQAQSIWKEFMDNHHATPDQTVRSRAGKTANQQVFAQQGISVSITRNAVDFIEIYRPCSLKEYLENIYSEPQPFIR